MAGANWTGGRMNTAKARSKDVANRVQKKHFANRSLQLAPSSLRPSATNLTKPKQQIELAAAQREQANDVAVGDEALRTQAQWTSLPGLKRARPPSSSNSDSSANSRAKRIKEFRLLDALDNRPMQHAELMERILNTTDIAGLRPAAPPLTRYQSSLILPMLRFLWSERENCLAGNLAHESSSPRPFPMRLSISPLSSEASIPVDASHEATSLPTETSLTRPSSSPSPECSSPRSDARNSAEAQRESVPLLSSPRSAGGQAPSHHSDIWQPQPVRAHEGACVDSRLGDTHESRATGGDVGTYDSVYVRSSSPAYSRETSHDSSFSLLNPNPSKYVPPAGTVRSVSERKPLYLGYGAPATWHRQPLMDQMRFDTVFGETVGDTRGAYTQSRGRFDVDATISEIDELTSNKSGSDMGTTAYRSRPGLHRNPD